MIEVGCNGLVVLFLDNALNFGKLWLAMLLPLGETVFLRLLYIRGTVLDGISSDRVQHFGVQRIIVGLRNLDIGCSILIVIWLYVGHDNIFGLEVVFADGWGGLVAGLESRGAAE